MTYIALLRGINVGGKNKISMTELTQVFERAGMQNVSTYINSGNVIFQSDIFVVDEIIQKLEEAIKLAFGFAVVVIVIEKDKIISLAKALPASWMNDTTMKSDVMFLQGSIDTPAIMEQLTIRPGIDEVVYVPGALLWSVGRKDVTKSGMMKLVGTDIYKQMTIRNCNTLRKLALLVS